MLELNLIPRKSISRREENASNKQSTASGGGALTTPNTLQIYTNNVSSDVAPPKPRPPLRRGLTMAQITQVPLKDEDETERRKSLVFFKFVNSSAFLLLLFRPEDSHESIKNSSSSAIDCRMSISPLKHLLPSRRLNSSPKHSSCVYLDPNSINKPKKSASFSDNLDKSDKEALEENSSNATPPKGKLAKFFGILSWGYEKSRIQKILPLLVLIGYTFAGAYIFSFFEHAGEDERQTAKRHYVTNETQLLFVTLRSLRQQFVEDINGTRDYSFRRKWMRKTEYEVSHQVYRFALVQYQSVDKELLLSKMPVRESETVTRLMEKHPILQEYAKSKLLPAGDFHRAVLRVELMLHYIDQLRARLGEIIVESADWLDDPTEHADWAQTRSKIEEALERFTSILGLQHDNHWSFENALMLAITTYTTIGYGNVVPRTKGGRLAVMIYAIVGIPLMLVILQKMGRALLKLLQRTYRQFGRLIATTCRCTWAMSSGDVSEEEQVPLTLAVGVTLAWMFISAELFSRAERHWDYFQSFYFVFISFATVGFGDVVPQSEWALWLFTLVFVGLSLLSMTINVIQIKLEMLFEAMWQELVQQYTAEGANLEAPPSDMSVWQMMRMIKKRRQSTHSSLGSVGAVPKRRRFGAKGLTGKDLLADWRRLSNMRNKSTQTNLADQVHCFVQTELRPGDIRPVDESPDNLPDDDDDYNSVDIFCAPRLVGASPPLSSFQPLHSVCAAGESTNQYRDSPLGSYPAPYNAHQQLPCTSTAGNDSVGYNYNRNLYPVARATAVMSESVCSEPDNQYYGYGRAPATVTVPQDCRHSIAWSDTNYFRQKLTNPMPLMREMRSIDVYDHQRPPPTRGQRSINTNTDALLGQSTSTQTGGTGGTLKHDGEDSDEDGQGEMTDAGKRWVFVKTGLGNRRGPRGLVNTQGTKRKGDFHHPDEMRQLLREINVRLNDCSCRQLVQDKPQHLQPSTVKAGQAIFRQAAVVLQPKIQEHKHAHL